MVFPKTLARRFFNLPTKNPPQTLTQSPIPPSLTPQNPSPNTFFRKFLTLSESDENGFFRRMLQKRAIFQSAMPLEYLQLPIGDKLIEKLKGLNKDRLRLDGLTHPSQTRPSQLPSHVLERISVEDVKKVLKISRLEMLKARLRHTPKNCVSYSEYLQICEDSLEGSRPDEVLELAKKLDESGAVIVLGNVVFLHPDQVVKAIERAIPLSVVPQPNDPRRKEFEKMEKEKEKIDSRAETLVRRELWCGLGFLVVQTAGFMRLTFWELSWDVMEPICFYVTSIYFMAGYAFFLRTSKDPSFEGFFESRFSAKQKRLMKLKKFDVERFNELRKACDHSQLSYDDHPRRTLLGAMHQ
ncbi:calcium uniporter protein 3, mitochondrial-like [Tasmannia lanceolata]|uniref:calcium uniporter protein 3, mitochondrial-like n=1 Tax=Tasmannia lanceolata TaxID=3420 RepID=UPI0040644544